MADETLAPRPQLAEGHVFEQDNRVCTITLRSGIRFHDGTPIHAQDCAASLRRWMMLAPMDQTVAAVTDELACWTTGTCGSASGSPSRLSGTLGMASTTGPKTTTTWS